MRPASTVGPGLLGTGHHQGEIYLLGYPEKNKIVYGKATARETDTIGSCRLTIIQWTCVRRVTIPVGLPQPLVDGCLVIPRLSIILLNSACVCLKLSSPVLNDTAMNYSIYVIVTQNKTNIGK